MTQKTLALLDICEDIVDCEHKTAPTAPEGYPSIRTPNIGKGRLDVRMANKVNKQTYLEWTKRTKPKPGDLIIAREAPVGNVAVITDGQQVCLGQRTVLIRPKENIADSNYLTYYLLKYENQKMFDNLSYGATVPHLNVADIKAFELEGYLSDYEAQKVIGQILSIHDDLVENNIRRIEVLEELAQLLYREWFVELRFPGHEKVKFVNSELGKIPEGWKMQSIGDIAEYYRGISYRSDNLVESGGIPFLNLKSMLVGGGYREDGLKGFDGNYKETHKVERGDIIVAITEVSPAREIIARAGQVPTLPLDFGVFSMDLIKIIPKKTDIRQFLYRLLRSYEYFELIKMYANGANVLHLNPKKIMSFEFLLPTHDLVEQFCKIDKEIFELKDNLMSQNQVLNKTRGLLLPKLMSGEVDVSKLDINITKN